MCKETEDKEKPRVTFDDVVEDLGTWDIRTVVGEEEWRGPFAAIVEAETAEQGNVNNKLLGELRDALELENFDSDDYRGNQRRDLWHRIDDAFTCSLYKHEKSFLLMGAALGMRMAGLEVAGIKQRMKWLV